MAAPLSPVEEAEQIAAVYEQTLFAGATWHVLSAKWWTSWCAFTGFNPNAGRATEASRGDRPGPIDNTPLLDSSFPVEQVVLRKDVQDGEDYTLVEQRTGQLLLQWYGGGPEIARQVVTVGIRKRTKVDLHPFRFRLLYCDRNGTELAPGVMPTLEGAAPEVPPAETAAVVKSLPAKAVLTDTQEELHNAVVEAEERKQKEDNMENDLPNVKESKEPEQEARVRLWVRKPKPPQPPQSPPPVPGSSTSASSSAAESASASASAAAAAAPAASDESNSNSSGAAMDVESTALVPISSVTDVSSISNDDNNSSSSTGAPLPNYSYEQEWKRHYSLAPPKADSLDEEEAKRHRLDPTDPGVRTTRLPVCAQRKAEDDGWRLLSEEDLTVELGSLPFLQPVNDLLVETSFMGVVGQDAEGVDNVGVKWPRERFAPQKRVQDADVGDIVDCKDTCDQWIEAQIKAVRPDAFFVHYIGWKSGWDEWVQFSDNRLALRHTHTHDSTAAASSSSRGYTSSRSNYYGSYNSNEEGKPEVSGAVGLRNLGNTCFMNSVLQCMSHCVRLTDYFLEDSYQADINKNNPLGWGGRVAEEYGKLLKQIWSDQYRVVSPRDFKAIISEVQPRFEGYAQHDSSELLSFLLDGLHEDLNRVRQKPATPAVESNGRPDAEVANESWEVYQKRNKSVVVDLLQGQLKSRVTCPQPDCGKVSVTFDPVQLLSVPLPVAQDTVLIMHFVPADASKPVLQVNAVVSKTGRLSELREAIATAVANTEPAKPNSKHIVLADIFSQKVYKFFDQDGLVSDIKGNDVVYAYECPEIEQCSGGFYPVQIVLQKQKTDHYTYSSCHARPRVMCFPKKGPNFTVRQVLERIHGLIGPHLRGGGTPEGQAPALTIEQAAECAYTVVIADERGDNCGVHESSYSYSRCSGCLLIDYGSIKEREAAADAEAKSKADAATNAWRANNAPVLVGNRAYDVLSGDGGMMADSDDDDDAVEVKVVDSGAAADDSNGSSGAGSAVLVPSPTTEGQALDSPDTVLVSKLAVGESASAAAPAAAAEEGYVQVGSEGEAKSPAAGADESKESEQATQPIVTEPDAEPAAPARNLDAPFELKAAASSSYMPEVIARMSFVVKLHNVEPPLPPAPVPAAAATDADAAMEEGVPAAAPAPVAADEPIWWCKEVADRHIKQATTGDQSPEAVEQVTIQDCLRAFAKEETLSEEEMWYCNKCKEHRQATKKFDLWRLPEVLVIHLKRFSYSKYSRDKISTNVAFPLVGLDLSEFTVNPAHQGDLYDCFAVSNHMGGLGGGHYTAYCQNHTDGRWYLHDDSSVSRVRHMSDIKSSSAYVLFYARRQRGQAVKTEAEIAAEMQAAAGGGHAGGSGSNGSTRMGYSSILDLD